MIGFCFFSCLRASARRERFASENRQFIIAILSLPGEGRCGSDSCGLHCAAAVASKSIMMNRVSRILRLLFAGLLLLVGVALLIGWWVVRRSLPQLDGSVAVTGLARPVTIDRDQWGRPWIRANSIED